MEFATQRVARKSAQRYRASRGLVFVEVMVLEP
jgi:hypothetical protein